MHRGGGWPRLRSAEEPALRVTALSAGVVGGTYGSGVACRVPAATVGRAPPGSADPVLLSVTAAVPATTSRGSGHEPGRRGPGVPGHRLPGAGVGRCRRLTAPDRPRSFLVRMLARARRRRAPSPP